MIKSFTAVTREIDDPKAAAAEILKALDLEKRLLKNSLGIVSCFSDFDDTGALKAVCDALPFETVGATTCLCSAENEIDQIILSVTVLTSDDCSFEAILIPVEEQYERSIESAMEKIKKGHDKKPALFLSYFPIMHTLSGDMILSVIDKNSGGVPLYGKIAIDHTADYSTAKTIFNGKAFREAVVLGAVYGDVEITFEIASLDDSKTRKQKAIITESDGNILIGVNGKTALSYLEEIGLLKDELMTGIVPFVVDHKDGTKPVARAIYAFTPEGHAVCGGAMPKGATLSIGNIDMGSVLQTSEETMRPLAVREGTVMSYSCLARFFILGADITAEAEKIKSAAGDANYLFAYAGGEICPLVDANGSLKNYFHNYTNVFCRLR